MKRTQATSTRKPETAHVRMTRRQLLAGTGQVAVLAMLTPACTPFANTPWADGTFWDDGQGWAD